LGTNNSVTVTPPQTTTYSVSVTDSCGIVTTASVTVNVMTVIAEFTFHYHTNNTINFINQSVNGVTYHWEFGEGGTSDLENPTYTYADTGYYIITLTVTNPEGCTSIVQHGIQIYPPFQLFVPNVFTPDGNGLNDYFAPIAMGVIKADMLIFSRWGNQIFHSTEVKPRWNGKDLNGELVEMGVYVYLLTFETPLGMQYTKRGSVTVMK
jgi:large repetitive protein